nr:MAG TPA: hypothetical protein [Caudoviricetes sp.]
MHLLYIGTKLELLYHLQYVYQVQVYKDLIL